MELKNSHDLFNIPRGSIVSKDNLYKLIQYSKDESSPYWAGQHAMICNTPQQGINWIGNPPETKAVIIKTRPGSYKEDGWTDESKSIFNYSFKARSGKISYEEKANQVLVKQPQHHYPIFLFSDNKKEWIFEGSFSVAEVKSNFVVLHRRSSESSLLLASQDELQYQEGKIKYVAHLMAERNSTVISKLKNSKQWICEICNIDFNIKYGVSYIEAHHKVPISTYSAEHVVNTSDLALLCPNCHKAVHIYMKTRELEYPEIKSILSQKSLTK